MKKSFFVIGAALSLCVSMSTQAATQQKPGLWASTVKIDMGGGFPQIDPAMLEQMEIAGSAGHHEDRIQWQVAGF